jgi:ribonuclease HI
MINYYTDGSASPNPGPGGFGVIKNGKPYIQGGELKSSNIRMEGMAILEALRDANGEKCEIRTDSEFWVNVLTKWAPAWEKNNWTKKGGIKNLDIVQPLFKLYKVSNTKLIWVRGHVGTELNELADELANKARKEKITSPVKISNT